MISDSLICAHLNETLRLRLSCRLPRDIQVYHNTPVVDRLKCVKILHYVIIKMKRENFLGPNAQSPSAMSPEFRR